MPKTDINSILKKGDKTKVHTVDYSTDDKKKQLSELKNKSETALNNKWSDPYKLSKLIIKR